MSAGTISCPLSGRGPHERDGRRRTLIATGLAASLILAVLVGASLLGDTGLRSDFSSRLLAPSIAHPFGTDVFGRDLFARTVKGLALSLQVGLAAAGISTIIALVLATIAATGGRIADSVVGFVTDMAMGLPHFVLLILVSFALGGGKSAVIVAVAVTHWPRLARILRAEILQAKTSDYVLASRGFGKSWRFIAGRHLLPQIAPQLLVGLLLLFPHAILHEAGLTFLGFGLEPNTPAIGVLLAGSMRFLTAGYWWLALFPGFALVVLVLAFDGVGTGLRRLMNPRETQD